MNDPERLSHQLEFLIETDQLKSVSRRTKPIGVERRENSAEHSWQVALSALLLMEHANVEVDILRVIKMLLIHDIVEIDVGDVFHHYKDQVKDLRDREEGAAKRLFGLLPPDQRDDLIAIWREFEARETNEAQYAAAIDRLMAFLMNSHHPKGGTWSEYAIAKEQIVRNNKHIEDGSETIWRAVQGIIAQAEGKGFLKPDGDTPGDDTATVNQE